jgi:hypothetical protein
LLDYKFVDIDPTSCEIPVIGLQKRVTANDDFKFKLQLQTKRTKSKLLLLNF